MTVRITVEETRQRRLVRVDGRLTVAELGELEGALGDPALTEIELRNLRSADAGSLAALRRWRAEGFTLSAVPPRFALEFDDESPGNSP